MSNYSIWPSDGSISQSQAIDLLRKRQAQMSYASAVALDAKVDWRSSGDELVNSIMDALVITPPPIKNSVKVGMPHFAKGWCEEVHEYFDWSGFPDQIPLEIYYRQIRIE